ncbi:MAG: hypothetical protein WD801_12980 [Gemmatimonadaceae bacterium]
MHKRPRFRTIALLLALAPAVAVAQHSSPALVASPDAPVSAVPTNVAPTNVAPAEVAPADVAPVAGPRRDVTAVAARNAAHASDATSTMQQSRGSSRPVTLMLVGAAAIVAGSLIGDTAGSIFMIGGAVAFLYGLYHYLQ